RRCSRCMARCSPVWRSSRSGRWSPLERSPLGRSRRGCSPVRRSVRGAGSAARGSSPAPLLAATAAGSWLAPSVGVASAAAPPAAATAVSLPSVCSPWPPLVAACSSAGGSAVSGFGSSPSLRARVWLVLGMIWLAPRKRCLQAGGDLPHQLADPFSGAHRHFGDWIALGQPDALAERDARLVALAARHLVDLGGHHQRLGTAEVLPRRGVERRAAHLGVDQQHGGGRRQCAFEVLLHGLGPGSSLVFAGLGVSVAGKVYEPEAVVDQEVV